LDLYYAASTSVLDQKKEWEEKYQQHWHTLEGKVLGRAILRGDSPPPCTDLSQNDVAELKRHCIACLHKQGGKHTKSSAESQFNQFNDLKVSSYHCALGP
jgi:hypothetical protein